ncbi:histidine kinase [Cohnella sp.]|uniref:sensor histidine kinase n=1 Tax=Cohnella sp. TaxID=1883426 RepID=UPI003568C212
MITNTAKFSSIKYKFVLVYLILTVVFSSTIIIFWDLRTKLEVESSANDYISDMLKISGDSLTVALKDIYALVSIASDDSFVIDLVANDKELEGYAYLQQTRQVSKYLGNMFVYKHYLNDIMIADLDGQTYSNGNTISFDYLKEQSWFSKIANPSGEIAFIQPHYNSSQTYVSSYSDDRVMSIARSVRDENQVLGFVIADVRSELLRDIFSSNMHDVNMLVAVRSSGETVYHSLDSGISSGEIAQLTQDMNDNEGNYYKRINGKDMFIVYRYMPTTDWLIVGAIPKQTLLTQYSQTRNTSLLLSLLFCIVAAGISIVASSVLTKPILRLNKAIKRFDGNQLLVHLDTNSKDEIGQLSRQFSLMVKRIQDLIINIKIREQEKRKAEIRALQAQINPHFLYNTLNTIKFLSVYHGADNIHDVAESLSRILHINMQEKLYNTVEEEREFLQSYLNIQEYKYSNKFTFRFEISDDIRSNLIPKLVLQPFVENSLIHGIGKKKGPGFILIKGYRLGDTIVFKIVDDGVGMTQDQIDDVLTGKQGGLGIRNVASRLAISYGEPYGVTISSEINLITSVEIVIPAIFTEESEAIV